MICQNESQWKYEIIELINSSFRLAQVDSSKTKQNMNYLQQNPIGTMADENLSTRTQCEDLSKTILMLNQMKNTFKQDYKENLKILRQTTIDEKITNFKIDFSTLLFKMEFNQPLFLNEQKYNINMLQSIYRYFLNEELPEELFIIATYHSIIEKSDDRTKKEVEQNLNKIFNELLIETQLIQKQKQISQNVFDQFNKYYKNFINKEKSKYISLRTERRRMRKKQAFQYKQP
ncbi:unnamed protein product [Paramecium pentaurelia]|uniref:Uncharacterized protein n=1 Tax=Paramecium pentaurelia TaxID=43138 RepID=A0A8S1U2P2_9CILI|nr:unnamed protein product [Paramecium pentaurelia]